MSLSDTFLLSRIHLFPSGYIPNPSRLHPYPLSDTSLSPLGYIPVPFRLHPYPISATSLSPFGYSPPLSDTSIISLIHLYPFSDISLSLSNLSFAIPELESTCFLMYPRSYNLKGVCNLIKNRNKM